MSESCFFCGGAAHDTTGCRYSESCLACRRCTESFWSWHRARQHTVFRRAPDGSKLLFCDAVARGIEQKEEINATAR